MQKLCGFFIYHDPGIFYHMKLYLRRTLVHPEYNSALGSLHISILNFTKANQAGVINLSYFNSNHI